MITHTNNQANIYFFVSAFRELLDKKMWVRAFLDQWNFPHIYSDTFIDFNDCNIICSVFGPFVYQMDIITQAHCVDWSRELVFS